MRKVALGLAAALLCALVSLPLSLPVGEVSAQTTQCGGSFVPSLNCVIAGFWNFTRVAPVSNLPVPFQAAGQDVTGIVSKVTDLSNAQVLALGPTQVTVVPAPGQGKYIDVIAVDLIFNYTAAYSSVANVKLYYGARESGNAASAQITGSGFFDASADKVIRVAGVPDNTNPPITNVAVVIGTTTGANMGGGNASNSVRVVVNYRIVATGL